MRRCVFLDLQNNATFFICKHTYVHVCVSLSWMPLYFLYVWAAEDGLGEGGGLYQEEAAPGLTAVLLCPQCPAVSQESRDAGTHVGLHTSTGTELQFSIQTHGLKKRSDFLTGTGLVCKNTYVQCNINYYVKKNIHPFYNNELTIKLVDCQIMNLLSFLLN